jgi:DNA-binding CsgD family transcriptional regulator
VQAGFELQARNLFGFTVREASLAASLASGRSVREAAEDAGIAYSTMRTYLENVFRKTETRQQSQLVALLRSLQPPIQS